MISEQIWNGKIEEVRARFFYPSVPKPILTKETPNGSADIVSNQIQINPDYIEMLSKKGIPEPDSLDEVLSHEFAHITRFPANTQRKMHLYRLARSALNTKNLSEAAVYAFNEAQANIYVGVDMGNKATPKVEKIIAIGSQGLNKVLEGLYQASFQEDLGIKLNRKEKKLVKNLAELDFTNQGSEDKNLRRFIELAEEYLKYYKPKTSSGFLGMFSQEQIDEGLSALAQECMDSGYTPDQFEQLALELAQEGKIPPAAGKEKGILRDSRDIYLKLARTYSIPIIRKSIRKNGSSIPEKQEPYSIGDSLQELDPFSSSGILPGITKKWTSREGELLRGEAIPNSIIIQDNSPSMPDPNSVISIPVLGSSVIARAYLLNNRTVTIYSFGSSDYVYGPSNDEAEINRVLRLHSGKKGGTTFNPEKLEALLKDRKDYFDISVVSDMEIKNLDVFTKSVKNIPGLHRVHLFYTNPAKIIYVNSIIESTKEMNNIGYAKLFFKEDIKTITMGELKKSLK